MDVKTAGKGKWGSISNGSTGEITSDQSMSLKPVVSLKL